MQNNTSLIINHSSHLEGEISIPGDKSITHRAIILGSLSNGLVKIKNALLSEDCIKTITAFRMLGVKISIENEVISIYGNGLNSLEAPSSEIDAGNSGTLARLISGILAAQNFRSSIIGDESLTKRPMKRIIKPLTDIGAKVISETNTLPISFFESSLNSINYTSSIPSAQIKSCLILASLFIEGESTIQENIKTRDHTERMLQYFEYPLSINNKSISLHGGGIISAKDITVPSDISSASFFIVGALIKPNSNITLKSIGVNPLRTGIIDILIKMGGDIILTNTRTIGNEPVADIVVKSSKLEPINLSGDVISRLIDELPILFIACACCDGISSINDIEELRHKESDRIKSMEEGLVNLGIKVNTTSNSINITGGYFKGGIVNSHGDHRIAMSFLIAGLIATKPITVINTNNINTSFPSFVDLLKEQKNEVYSI